MVYYMHLEKRAIFLRPETVSKTGFYPKRSAILLREAKFILFTEVPK